MTEFQAPDDRETFARVWRRVSPEPRADSPIEVYADTDADADTEEFLYLTPPSGGSTALALHSPEPGGHPLDGAELAPLLQNLILRELVDMRVFQALRRAARGAEGRRLAELADRAAAAAKRLAAAYFFLSGRQYWPLDGLPRAEASGLPALRTCFLRAEKSRAECLRMAEHTTDAALRALCRELAAEKELQVRALRAAVEARIAT